MRNAPEPTREYSDDELVALREVCRQVWSGVKDPTTEGPAQYAGGDYWPGRLERMAADMERRAPLYRTAAAALRREIQRDPRTAS